MADKVTKMVLKVDLQCPRCYKKIKKILQKFPATKGKELSFNFTWFFHFGDKRNSRPDVQREGKHGDNHCRLLQPRKDSAETVLQGCGNHQECRYDDIIEPPRPAIPNPPLKHETAGADDTRRLRGQVEDLDIPPLRPPPEKKKEPKQPKPSPPAPKPPLPEKPTESPEPIFVPGYPPFYPI
ncbi:hypothetical protein L1049_010490 [Liquidambar formosana]|uniref:Uncharacterized protein n=1 Tax=Liquidambar formosana TaxID=63359 RepID=A0AAP0R759_LIQFO